MKFIGAEYDLFAVVFWTLWVFLGLFSVSVAVICIIAWKKAGGKP